MDILDIDEALKDDSFIFLEDKTHDDISNILQQWKSNNYLPPPSSSSAQTQQQEQVYKYDSRTFTRPKRKSAQNLDLQFTNTANATQFSHHLQEQQQQENQQNVFNSQGDNPMFNLEIGGLVTNMHKSLLHDTSPPSFTSMDASIDRMNNSLITSADFSNINFLQSTNSLDFGATDINRHAGEFNLMGKITSDGYSLSDMIRDRKALESLTLSGEGTLIKDTQIGQIDEISLALSKTASGCSTMDNSTDSVEANNRTVEINNKEHTLDSAALKTKLAASGNSIGSDNGLNRTIILTDEMIGDITYNLVENSLYGSMASEQLAVNKTQDLAHSHQSALSSVHIQPQLLDETVCITTSDSAATNCEKGNSTYDCQENSTPNNRCETPEGMEKQTSASLKFYESTPQTTSVRYNKQHYTPTLKMVDDVNISPIIASSSVLPHNSTRILNDTFEKEQRSNKLNNVNTKTFSGKLPLNATVEMIDNIENPNVTFDKQFRLYDEATRASQEMQNVMDLAQAEANLLASNNNEEEFDHMLDEFSKIELNAEQLKMKKSLDSIKRRFNYGSNKENTQHREISREAMDMREMLRATADLLGDEDVSSKDYLNMTVDLDVNESDEITCREKCLQSPQAVNEIVEAIKSPLRDSVTSSSSISESKFSNGASVSSVSSASNGGERLLSRRSRLYDDINLSTLSAHGTKTSLGCSYTLQKDGEPNDDSRASATNETESVSGQNALEMVQEKTESAAEEIREEAGQTNENLQETTAAANYRLAEKRERDRDRFKTIKINKNRNGAVDTREGGVELNVPCIDDYEVEENNDADDKEEQQPNQRFSRRDQTVSPVFNNNKSEVEIVDTNKTTSKINPNYLTYKKPKDKVANVRNLPEIAPAITNTIAVASDVSAISKPRSLSRPRYLSGLTKLSAVNKATSADELQKSVSRNINGVTSVLTQLGSGISKGSSAVNVSQNRTQNSESSNQQPATGLKSPMGIKSKSFHNLSSNHTSTSNSNVANIGGISAPRAQGLRRPSGTSSEKLARTNPNRYSTVIISSNSQNSNMQQKTEEGVFKVPKLLSGLRAPGAGVGGCKRAGLVRPSSGYYSLSVAPKGSQPLSADTDNENGRNSPTDSMSSASSRGSIQNVNKPEATITTGGNNVTTKITTPSVLTKITIGSTGIPKPSGLRPPNAIKRSGLPRPSSLVRTEK